MSIYVNSCITLGNYNLNPCGDKELGRIRSIALVKKTSTIADPTDNAEWVALQTAGNCILIPRVRGTYDGGVDTESTGFGEDATEYTGRNHQVQYFDPNLSQNNKSFYEVLRKASKDFRLWYATESKIWEVQVPIQLSAKSPITENLTDQIVWDVMIKWADENLPNIYDKPTFFDA